MYMYYPILKQLYYFIKIAATVGSRYLPVLHDVNLVPVSTGIGTGTFTLYPGTEYNLLTVPEVPM